MLSFYADITKQGVKFHSHSSRRILYKMKPGNIQALHNRVILRQMCRTPRVSKTWVLSVRTIGTF